MIRTLLCHLMGVVRKEARRRVYEYWLTSTIVICEKREWILARSSITVINTQVLMQKSKNNVRLHNVSCWVRVACLKNIPII